MYNPDPFAAKKEVEARQETASKRREEGSSDSRKDNSGAVGEEFIGVIEVKMSGGLRELVESAIKKASPPCCIAFLASDSSKGARFPPSFHWKSISRNHKSLG